MQRLFVNRAHRVALAVPLLLALAACGGSDEDDAPTPPPMPVTAKGTISGTVKSSIDSTPIAGATVSNGSVSAQTNADGKFQLTNVVPAERAVLRVNAKTFSEGLAVTSVTANQTSTVAVQLYPVGMVSTGVATNAITVTVPNSPARVELPANGLVRPNGAPPVGNVTVALTPVQPAVDVNAMPGEYRVAVGSGVGLMESWGAINVTLTDSDGTRLNLGSGKTATIQIPVSTRSEVKPTTIPLFYFDESIGLWKQEGSATLQGVAPNQYYKGTVSHFTYWNADKIMDTIYVSGCVKNNTAPAVGARAIVDGIDYSNASSALTGTDGKFRVPMKKNARATLTALSGINLSNTITVGPSATDIDLGATCLNLAPLTNGINIKLTWGELPYDIDSHLFAPDGSHVYFWNKGSLTAAPFANLDVDDTDSFGPEFVTLTKLMVGTYTYAVHNYSGTFNPGMTGSPVRVELNQGGTTRVFSPPPGEGNFDYWTVFTLKVNAQCGITVTPVNTWSSAALERLPATTSPQYCTP
jgi:hypothetical protein